MFRPAMATVGALDITQSNIMPSCIRTYTFVQPEPDAPDSIIRTMFHGAFLSDGLFGRSININLGLSLSSSS